VRKTIVETLDVTDYSARYYAEGSETVEGKLMKRGLDLSICLGKNL
jgi:hypothetical protein